MAPGEVAGRRDVHLSITFRCEFGSPEGCLYLEEEALFGHN